MIRILFVDDDTDYLRVLSYAFMKDFEVSTASGVREAMKFLNEKTVDMVCSDLHMHGEKGTHLQWEMKQSGMDIPFVLMSGDSDSMEIEIAKSRGATFVPKDWNMVNQIKQIAESIKDKASIGRY